MNILDTRISFFEKEIKQVIPNKTVTAGEILKNIKEGKWKKEIEKIRSLSDKVQKISKSYLPYVTWSGTFKKRNNDELKEWSGILCIDIDNVETYNETFATICNDEYTLAAFASPTGTGIKVLWKIGTPEFHNKLKNGIILYCKSQWKTEIDNTFDVSRPCFISYDPQCYVNEDSTVYGSALITDTETSKPVTQPVHIEKSQLKDLQRAEDIVTQCEQNQIDITSDYNEEWQLIAFSLATFGEAGRALFHRISAINGEYDAEQTDKKFTDALQKGKFKTPAKFFVIAKDYGIVPQKQKKKQTTDNSVSEEELNEARIVAAEAQKRDAQNANRKKRMILKTEQYLNEHYDIRNNIIKNEFEISKKDKNEWDKLNENNLFREFMYNGVPFTISQTLCLLRSDFVPRYNPFHDYFNKLELYNPESEPDYLNWLANCVTADSQEQFNYHLKKQMVRVVACALNENYYNKHCFTLVSEEQHIGKSKFIEFLVPEKLKEYYLENPAIDKDGMLALGKNIIINLDELANFSRHDINQMKAYISKSFIKLRPAYEKKEELYPRVSSFFGTTNRTEFLSDETGSVRWLNFKVSKFDFKKYLAEKNIINNCYRQALHLYKQGTDSYLLNQEDIISNEERNKDFQVPIAERDLLLKYFYPGTEQKHDVFLTATEIAAHISVKANGQIKISNIMMGRMLSSLKFPRSQKFNGWQQTKGYYLRYVPEDGIIPEAYAEALINGEEVAEYADTNDKPF